MNKKLPLLWYMQGDVAGLAKKLLGKVLCTNIDGYNTSGIIVETEAYCSINDKACHANGQKKTERNAVMFEEGGHAYVYLCYGIHHLFNVVTNRKGVADAVLVRAVQPVEGLGCMLLRRGLDSVSKRLTAGPGMLTQAMGIEIQHNGIRLDGHTIWVEDGADLPSFNIVETTRIGVAYAEEDALKPWRFYIKNNEWVSKIV
jgi:DNA-3-methyladenine glycosylase